LRGATDKEALFCWIARGTMILVMAAVMYLVKLAWSRK